LNPYGLFGSLLGIATLVALLDCDTIRRHWRHNPRIMKLEMLQPIGLWLFALGLILKLFPVMAYGPGSRTDWLLVKAESTHWAAAGAPVAVMVIGGMCVTASRRFAQNRQQPKKTREEVTSSVSSPV
jgi:hypothetical protein